MKKIFFLAIIAFFAINMRAQEKLTLKAGTVVPLQSVNAVKAADVAEGQTVDFTVSGDVKVNNKVVISRGTLVKGKVSEARKSTIAGTKGRLVININSLTLPNGEPLYFTDTTVRIYGHNKTPLAVGLGILVWPCIFIPGTRAEMPAGYEVQATVASNTEISL